MAEANQDSCQLYENLVICVEKFIANIRGKPGSCKKLAKSFPPCYNANKEVVQIASDNLWGTFEASVKDHVSKVLQDLQLKSRLNKITETEVEHDTISWKATGNPQVDAEANLGLAKHMEISKLTDILQEKQSEICLLEDNLSRKENHLRAMLNEVVNNVESWEQMNAEFETAATDLQYLDEKSHRLLL